MGKPEIFLLSLIFFFTSISYAFSGNYLEKKPGSKNDTELFQDAIKNNKSIYLSKGDYFLEYNKLFANHELELCGDDGVKIHGIGNKEFKSLKPYSLITVSNPTRVIVDNISFYGKGNQTTAIAIQQSTYKDPKPNEIIIKNNFTSEIGLTWIGPEKGFTFNRNAEEFINWAQSGPIHHNNWESHIFIFNNTCRGNTQYSPGSFEENSISAITVLYANNMEIFQNKISNYRFGIWSYGGASRSENNKFLSNSEILSRNIHVFENRISNTYSPIWFSKSGNIRVHNNISINNQDVALDFEGCKDAEIVENKITNSRGGALVVLNGSENIRFKNNTVYLRNFNTQNNIVLLRDGNRDISYKQNEFFFTDERFFGKRNSRVLLNNSSNHIRDNSKILFYSNKFENVEFDVKNGEDVFLEENKFASNLERNYKPINVADNISIREKK